MIHTQITNLNTQKNFLMKTGNVYRLLSTIDYLNRDTPLAYFLTHIQIQLGRHSRKYAFAWKESC